MESTGYVVYQDDILPYRTTDAELRKGYKTVMERLKSKQFTANEGKCASFTTNLSLLDYEVLSDGVKLDTKHSKVLLQLQLPKNVKEVEFFYRTQQVHGSNDTELCSKATGYIHQVINLLKCIVVIVAWWPLSDNDIEYFLKKCTEYNNNRPRPKTSVDKWKKQLRTVGETSYRLALQTRMWKFFCHCGCLILSASSFPVHGQINKKCS